MLIRCHRCAQSRCDYLGLCDTYDDLPTLLCIVIIYAKGYDISLNIRKGLDYMNNLISNNTGLSLTTTDPATGSSLASALLGALPNAFAKPVLDYQRTKEQAEIIKAVIEARKQERADILATLRDLAQCDQLTPELYKMLLVAYEYPTFS